MGQKEPEPKEKPASELTDNELAEKVFPPEILEWIEDQEPVGEDEDDSQP